MIYGFMAAVVVFVIALGYVFFYSHDIQQEWRHVKLILSLSIGETGKEIWDFSHYESENLVGAFLETNNEEMEGIEEMFKMLDQKEIIQYLEDVRIIQYKDGSFMFYKEDTI